MEDLIPLQIPKKYEEVSDVVEYKMQNTREVLPFIRCPDCNGNIFRQSEVVRQNIDAYQEEVRRTTGLQGVSRGMTTEEYSKMISVVIEEANLARPCCKMSMIEQLIIPIDVPSYVDRYIPSIGEPVGNVKIRYLPENAPVVPYNPYSFSMLDLRFEPEDDEESSPEPSEERIISKRVDIYPSMPPIDDSFEEVPASRYKTREYVAGIIDTGLPGLESILVKGREIQSR